MRDRVVNLDIKSANHKFAFLLALKGHLVVDSSLVVAGNRALSRDGISHVLAILHSLIAVGARGSERLVRYRYDRRRKANIRMTVGVRIGLRHQRQIHFFPRTVCLCRESRNRQDGKPSSAGDIGHQSGPQL